MTFIGWRRGQNALESAALIYAQDIGTGKKYIQSGARYGAARQAGVHEPAHLGQPSATVRN
jgi:hypothetical protein